MTKIALTQSRTVASRNEATTEGDVAASVFERFDRGTSPDEVVTELALAVDTVEYPLFVGSGGGVSSRIAA